MPTLAIVDGVKIRHHIFTQCLLNLWIPAASQASIRACLGRKERPRVDERLDRPRNRPKANEAAVSEIIRIKSVEPVLFGVVKIVWLDGYEAIVDLRLVIAAESFGFLRSSPGRFGAVKLAEFGHSIYWLDDEGDEIDLGSDSLRRRAIRQAEILRLAS
jgi:hypothetical protein